MDTLALDLGTVTGWARCRDGRVESGVLKTKAKAKEPLELRFGRFSRWLDENGAGVVQVRYELVRGHKGMYAAQVYGGFFGVLGAWASSRAIPLQGVHTGTLKRATTGKGNADKAAMLAAVRKLGFEPRDDNEGDAIALLMLPVGHV
jgi:Holliday junction resolvasome RuvABC endonuclease subunit